MKLIKESEMFFGSYPDDRVFRIENSDTHRRAGEGIHSVEFIYLQENDKLLFVEAKSSFPRLATSKERYDEFINEIYEKFIHSFDLYIASKVGRYTELGGMIKDVKDSELKYRFVLVINGHKDEWLLPITEELNSKLKYHKKIWKSEVVAINEKTAEKFKLINAK